MAVKSKGRMVNRTGSPSQIPLVAAISKELTNQGFPYANARQLNSLIEAANLVAREYGTPHRPSSPGIGLAAWLATDDTGDSSLEMAWNLRKLVDGSAPVGRPAGWDGPAHPRDPDDLGRCIRLLEAVPEFRPLLPNMAGVSPVWGRLVAAWEELEALYREELATGRAPKCYARMEQVLDGAEADR